MTALAMAISRALIYFVWQGLIAGFLLWLVLAALRNRSANWRYISSCVALGVMAFMPVITAWLLYRRQISTPGATATAWLSQPVAAAAAGSSSQLAGWSAALQTWALPAWSLGVLLFSVRLLLGYRHALTLGRRGRPALGSVVGVIARLTRLMGVERPVRVLVSAFSDTPSVVGWLRPVILLPAATCMGLTPLQLEAILAHEIGHIKRYDYLVNMIQMMVETVLFYHPAVWWTSKRIRLERELCCDDLAVRFSGNALRYARALSTLEKLRLSAPRVAMASTGGPLLYRIQRLAGVRAQEYGPSRLPAALAIGLGVVCFALNVHWLRGQDAPGVKVDLAGSAVIHRNPVVYPEAARRQSLSGTVQLEVTLDTAGNVADAHVLAGPEELRKAALKSVLDWHFTRDAAGSTRLINISFSGEARQAQVLEPLKAARAAAGGNSADVPAAVERELKQAASQLKIAAAEAAELAKIREAGIQELTRRQQLERGMADVKKQIEMASRNSEAASAAQLKIKLLEMQREFDQTPFPGKIGPIVMAGRALKRIDVSDLPDAVRDDLVSHLPVREGDILSRDSIEETARALRALDEHLKVQLRPTDDGQAEIRIVAPR